MTRQLLVATFALAMVGTTAPAAVASAGPDPAFPASTYQESFEEGFGGWEPDTNGRDMSFWLLNEIKSPVNAWPVVAYIGLDDPTELPDFTVVGNTQETVGWHQYFHRQDVATGDADQVWIAFGFGATWEVERTHLLDLVEVNILAS